VTTHLTQSWFCFQVRLRHVETQKNLYSQEYAFGAPINGQREVSGVPFKDRFTEWQTAEGIYFPHEKVASPAKDEL
jgi:hypothetical protein